MRTLPRKRRVRARAAARGDYQKSIALDLSKKPKEYKVAPARDPIVKVREPCIVYVQQNKQARVLIQWLPKRAGQVTVPLRAVDDGSGLLVIGVAPIKAAVVRTAPDEQSDCPPRICSDCLDAYYTCCMLTGNK